MIVYLITNTVNGKFYVGQFARNLPIQRRLYEHIWTASKGSTTYFHKALRKYGREAFTLSILQDGIQNKAELDAAEERFIRTLKSGDPRIGYNMTFGGDGVLGVRRPVSAETREKIRQSKLGKKRPDVSERWRRSHAARTPEERTIKQKEIMASLLPESRERMLQGSAKGAFKPGTAPQNGFKSGNRHGEANKGRTPWKGRSHSLATIRKLSEAKKVAWQSGVYANRRPRRAMVGV